MVHRVFNLSVFAVSCMRSQLGEDGQELLLCGCLGGVPLHALLVHDFDKGIVGALALLLQQRFLLGH